MNESPSATSPTNLSELAQYLVDDINAYFAPFNNWIISFHWDIDFDAGWGIAEDTWKGYFEFVVINDPRPFDLLNITQRTGMRFTNWFWSTKPKSSPTITSGYKLAGRIQIYVDHWKEQFMTDKARINHLLLHPGTKFKLEDSSYFTYEEEQDNNDSRASHAN